MKLEFLVYITCLYVGFQNKRTVFALFLIDPPLTHFVTDNYIMSIGSVVVLCSWLGTL